MSSGLKKAATVCLSLFLLAYVGYQVYAALYNPVKTKQASKQTVQDTITSEGYIVNDEQTIAAKANGIIDYAVEDGAKVAKGGVVANVYSSAQQAENQRQIAELDSKIKQLQMNYVAGDSMALDMDVLNSELDQKFAELADKAQQSDVQGITELQADYLNLLNEKEIVTGKTSNFNDQLGKLTAERQKLAGQQQGNVSQITSPVSGYFVSRADGFEGNFKPQNVLSITPTQVNALLSSKPHAVAGDTIGKIVSSYEWYIVCTVGQDDARKLSQGGQVGVTIPLSTESNMPAIVAAVNKDAKGNTAVVLECGYMTSDLSVLRSCNVTITVSQYTGIKVDDASVHIRNGVKGVYILMGDTVQFRKLDVVYSGDGYLISKIDSTDQNKLQLYDEVITEGRDLYDGKVIK